MQENTKEKELFPQLTVSKEFHLNINVLLQVNRIYVKERVNVPNVSSTPNIAYMHQLFFHICLSIFLTMVSILSSITTQFNVVFSFI